MNDALVQSLLKLAEKGSLGLAVIVMGWVVVQLYRENKELRREKETLHDRLLDEREKRVTTNAEALQAVRASSADVKETAGMLSSILRSMPPRQS